MDAATGRGSPDAGPSPTGRPRGEPQRNTVINTARDDEERSRDDAAGHPLRPAEEPRGERDAEQRLGRDDRRTTDTVPR